MNDTYPIEIFQTKDGRVRLEVQLKEETVWLNQTQLVKLFERDELVISRHINNVFKEGKLRPEATVAKFATVQSEGGNNMTACLSCLFAWSKRRNYSQCRRKLN